MFIYGHQRYETHILAQTFNAVRDTEKACIALVVGHWSGLSGARALCAGLPLFWAVDGVGVERRVVQ